jgi:hypothetical protein
MNSGGNNGIGKSNYYNTSNGWDDSDIYRINVGVDDYWDNRSSGKSKRKHEFSPVLLVFTTVYNCKHCGAKKEDCKTSYCDEFDLDIGDW